MVITTQRHTFLYVYAHTKIAAIAAGNRMEDSEIIKVLNSHNPWWNGNLLKVPQKARRDFYILEPALEEKLITALLGPRRVGKSVLMAQLAKGLLDRGVEPKRILFVRLDEPLFDPLGASLVHSVIDAYLKYILEKEYSDIDERVYIFLDEVQHVPKWSETLKSYYDREENVKFVVSGSSAAGITRGSAESLAGRIKQHYVMTLKFSDFLKFRGFSDDFDRECMDLRSRFRLALIDGNLPRFWLVLRRFAARQARSGSKSDAFLMDYLVKGGYIELVSETDYQKCAKYIFDLVQLVIYRDIIKVFDIRNPKNMEDFLLYLARHSSDKMSDNSLRKISSELKIEINTLRQYLDYLEQVFFVSSSMIFAPSRAKQLRNPKKIYITNVGIRNVFNSTFSALSRLDPLDLGKMVETVVHDHSLRLAFYLDQANARCYYWSNGGEIDNVISFGKTNLPIESKYQNEIKTSDYAECLKFIHENKCPFGVVVTKKKLAFDEKNRLFLIPLKIFLIMC